MLHFEVSGFRVEIGVEGLVVGQESASERRRDEVSEKTTSKLDSRSETRSGREVWNRRLPSAGEEGAVFWLVGGHHKLNITFGLVKEVSQDGAG